MSFDVESEINGNGIKISNKRIISLAMLCVRQGIDGIRRIAVNESRMGIWWGITKLIKPEEAKEIKTVDVKVIAEAHEEGDICKRGRIEFDPPLYFVMSPLGKNRIGFKEMDDKVTSLAESVTGGLIDFLTTYGTVLEYLEDGEMKCHLVRDVDEIPEKVFKGLRLNISSLTQWLEQFQHFFPNTMAGTIDRWDLPPERRPTMEELQKALITEIGGQLKAEKKNIQYLDVLNRLLGTVSGWIIAPKV